jgi:hypothetical protein
MVRSPFQLLSFSASIEGKYFSGQITDACPYTRNTAQIQACAKVLHQGDPKNGLMNIS